MLFVVCVLTAVSVRRRGPGGDGEAEEGAHRGAEGDQEAAGKRGNTVLTRNFLFTCLLQLNHFCSLYKLELHFPLICVFLLILLHSLLTSC